MNAYKIKAVVPFSGGLDSMLAIRILQEQGIEIEAIKFRTPFDCCSGPAQQWAKEFNFAITFMDLKEAYLRTIENPRHAYGRGINPCVDCRIHMFDVAKTFMEQTKAQFMATGEVVGQRPNSQRKDCLKSIDNGTGLGGLILRPLSAKLLPETLPEQKGWVDRQKLYRFYGRGRKGLIDLAKGLGIKEFPMPFTGCLLTDKNYARRVRDFWKTDKANMNGHHYEIFKVGRHFRLKTGLRIIVGKNEEQNKKLETLAQEGMHIFHADNFLGPCIIALHQPTAQALDEIQGIMSAFAKNLPTNPLLIHKPIGSDQKVIAFTPKPFSREQLKALQI